MSAATFLLIFHSAGALVNRTVLKITMICVCGLVKAATAAGKYLNNCSRKCFLSLFMSRACSCLDEDAIAATLKRSVLPWNSSLGLVVVFLRWNSCRCLLRHYLLSAFFSVFNLTVPQASPQFTRHSENFLLVCHPRSKHPSLLSQESESASSVHCHRFRFAFSTFPWTSTLWTTVKAGRRNEIMLHSIFHCYQNRKQNSSFSSEVFWEKQCYKW